MQLLSKPDLSPTDRQNNPPEKITDIQNIYNLVGQYHFCGMAKSSCRNRDRKGGRRGKV
jgi:hypothetical protein